MNEVELKVRKVVSNVMNNKVPAENIVGENMIEELGITSIDALEILVNIENEFGIMVDDDDLSQDLIVSIKNLITYIEKKQSEPVASS